MSNLARLAIVLLVVDVASAQEVYEPWPFGAAEAVKRQADTARAISASDPLKLLLPGGKATLDFRLIPAGKYMMGSPATEPGHEGDERLREEIVREPFYMMRTQLTNEAYRALLGADPIGTPEGSDPQLPAAVEYREAVDKVMPAIAKLAPKGWRVILPDRARLEYAARAGAATMNHGGDSEKDADAYVWSKNNSDGRMHPVAQKKPNAWGLHDVIGNRWHWVWVGPGGGYGDASKDNHLVYGGSFNTPASGNGARLANIMISQKAEGARYALIRSDIPLPKGHPETSVGRDK